MWPAAGGNGADAESEGAHQASEERPVTAGTAKRVWIAQNSVLFPTAA